MPEYLIGKTAIPYKVVENRRVTRKSLTLGREQLEVKVPFGTTPEEVDLFLQQKQAWIFEQWQNVNSIDAIEPWPERFMSGAKILYMGRHVRLTVTTTDNPNTTISFENGFHVELQKDIPFDKQHDFIKSELQKYLTRDLKQIIQGFIDAFAPKLGVRPAGFRVSESSRYWGYCDIDGALMFNWQLIFAPRQVIQYVVIHELAHLIHRNHGQEFWLQIATMLPDYGLHKVWLDREGRHLDI